MAEHLPGDLADIHKATLDNLEADSRGTEADAVEDTLSTTALVQEAEVREDVQGLQRGR